MKMLKLIVALLLMASQALAGDPLEDRLKNEPALSIGTQNKTQITATEIASGVSVTEAANLLASRNLDQIDMLITTDSEVVTRGAFEMMLRDAKNKIDRQIRVITLGPLANAKNDLTGRYKKFKENALDTLKNDKVGVTILLVTTGIDSFLWYHAAATTQNNYASMIVLNVVLAATFGLDRDLWVDMTRPLRHRIIATFDKLTDYSSAKFDKSKEIAAKFAANLAFGIAFQTFRATFLSSDKFTALVTSSQFWKTSLVIGTLMTITHFAWAELFDEARSPVARLVLKRFTDFRYVVLSQVASLSMLFNSEIYGNRPAYAVLIHASAGLFALIYSDEVIRFLETNKYTKRFYTVYTWVEGKVEDARIAATRSFVDTYKNITDYPDRQIYLCRDLFR